MSISQQQKSPDSQAGAGCSSTQSQSCDSAQSHYHEHPLTPTTLGYLIKSVIKQIESASVVDLNLVTTALVTLRQAKGYLDYVEQRDTALRARERTLEEQFGRS